MRICIKIGLKHGSSISNHGAELETVKRICPTSNAAVAVQNWPAIIHLDKAGDHHEQRAE